MEDKEELIKIKDMFIKCNGAGDLQLRILPVNASPYIIDTKFNIKDLMLEKVSNTAQNFEQKETKEKFMSFAKGFIDEEYKRITSLFDCYVMENCAFNSREGIIELSKSELDNLSNICIDTLFDSMYNEKLEIHISTIFYGRFVLNKAKYYMPAKQEITEDYKITKKTKKMIYYNCAHCIEKYHLKGLFGDVMIRYFCNECNCEITSTKAIQYGEDKAYYHNLCLKAKLRKKRDLTRQDIEQIITENEIYLKRFFYCKKCGKAIKECVVKYNKKMYDIDCFRTLIENEKGYKLTDEEFDSLVSEYEV